ncbi:DUF485 domain-containing protein [Streptomyces sporangiiformans]|uniref:DUF485 domain-containing protein n=2 Tax=Streptomyces sporangiiformans TaxID=2315329 RepID=A0A505D9D8_9ACTN|nr:DUF485 domain-containing protein [Streptomyces sporangiiformans]TPQ21073.1 DUF485 domain-containing protein [Streptomyces sporangiiformans]
MPTHSSPHYSPHSGQTPPSPPDGSRAGDSRDFRAIRVSHRSFGIVAMAISVGGFLLFVLLSSFAPGLLNQPLFGHVTLGLACGVGAFVVMGLTAWRYTLHMERHIDPATDRLRAEIEHDEAQQTRTQQTRTQRTRGPQQRRFGAW